VTAEPRVVVRGAIAADIPELVDLITDHAAFERAAPPHPELSIRLPGLLFGPAPRLHAFVAAAPGGLVGYATASREVSTWRGTDFMHLDCLFVAATHRGSGTGRLLIDAVTGFARAEGVDELQWQTPQWNTDAARFYDRLGARFSAKLRYSLPL